MIDFETARQNLSELINFELEAPHRDRNEAETRLQLIDSILFKCLGWDNRECFIEHRHNGDYADYILGDPIKQAIWEAKRESISFELPAGLQKRICKIETLNTGQTLVREAILQVLSYCQSRSVPIGVVCNGTQIIAFLAARTDGVPALDGQALVFTSLADIASSFRVFWDNLSKPGADSYNLFKILRSESAPPPPEKPSQRISSYPGFKNRNAFQAELKTLGQLFIEDLGKTPSQEEDFLRQCYSAGGAVSQYALISRQILQARYSLSQLKELRIPHIEAVADKGGEISAVRADVLATALSRRPIIIMGDVGVGKTMFLRNLIKIRAKEILEKAIVLYVDFGKEPALADDLESFVLKKCESQLRSDHGIDLEQNNFVRGIYHFDLKRFEGGIHGQLRESDPAAYALKEIEFLEGKLKDRAAHLRSSLEHLVKGRKQQVVVFLDNIDQRPVEFQERVFLIGQSLAETWPVAVFISLRPDTFHHSRTKGALQAYQPRVFTVDPPRIDLVVIRRLEYALDQLRSTGRLDSFPQGLSLSSTSLTHYLTALLESCKQSPGLMEFIDNLSGGNVREALTFVEAFVGSGHVNAYKIIKKVELGGYVIPVHEFMRSVIYGDHEYYDPGASPICNVFDIAIPDGREHFLLLNILAMVERSGSSSEGFVSATSIFSFAQDLGFQPNQVHFALDRALGKRLLTSNPSFTANAKALAYRTTTVGGYTLKRLVKMFTYLDAMIVDTPIVDDSVRAVMSTSEDIVDRLSRAKTFIEYLDDQWKKLVGRNVAFDWNESAERISGEIRAIAAKQLGPRRFSIGQSH